MISVRIFLAVTRKNCDGITRFGQNICNLSRRRTFLLQKTLGLDLCHVHIYIYLVSGVRVN